MNAKEILKQWLEDNGHDGLCTTECGCGLDDFIPCDNDPSRCVAATRTTVDENNEFSYEDLVVGDTIYVPSNRGIDGNFPPITIK